MTAQPTDADRETVLKILGFPPGYRGKSHVARIAQAIADARAEGVAHAARIVQDEADARGRHTSELDQTAAGALDAVARRLRKEATR